MSNPPVYYVPRSDWGRTWLFSDPHFDHANIIRYCNRPFRDVEEMNSVIICNWNNRIGRDDLVFFLGDMAFGRGSRRSAWWLEQLNGRLVYVVGSHDKGIHPGARFPGVEAVTDAAILVTDAGSLFLSHEPFCPNWWTGWLVHGHVHNNKPHLYTAYWALWARSRVNVSAEAVGYAPITVGKLVGDTVRRSAGG